MSTLLGMAVKTMNISLPGELKQFIESRVRSGLYGNASDVVRAGLRALAREEIGPSLVQFERIMAALPQDPITPEIEQDIEKSIRDARIHERRKDRR
jgi:antitoxin ParD1/3/4